MAAKNKCLAQNNKSRHVIRATKDVNGHRRSVQPKSERPEEMQRSAAPCGPRHGAFRTMGESR